MTSILRRFASAKTSSFARALFLSNATGERIEALDAGVPFHWPFGNRQDDGSESNRENISSTPLHISGVSPFRRHWRNPHAFILAVSRRISRITSVERNSKKMKTFIVYDLDSQMPVAVGEQVSAETARYCASVALEFSTQICWQKKLIWKNKLRTERQCLKLL